MTNNTPIPHRHEFDKHKTMDDGVYECEICGKDIVDIALRGESRGYSQKRGVRMKDVLKIVVGVTWAVALVWLVNLLL